MRDTSSRRGMTTTLTALALIALMVAASYSAYFAYETRVQGGISYSGYSVTLTKSTVHLDVPKGAVLVVIPQGIGSNSKLTFEPQYLFLVIGVNNTILFDNQDTTEHIIQSVQWPAGGQPIDVWLVQGETSLVKLNTTGTYVYNFELNPIPENATITVV